jgi:cbb3-type cytochrome oxidase subunit 3
MDEWMDNLWDRIVDLMVYIAALLDRCFAPLNQQLGPAVVILIIVVALVALTKLLGRLYNTQRYLELKKNYEHWYTLRSEAMACQDREKGKILARNIDQAQLNKAYYDYFFEGFLKSIATAILPILFAAAYVNHAYGPDRLMALIGRKVIFVFPRQGGDSIAVSAFFWFVICLVLVYIAWFTVAFLARKRLRSPTDGSKPTA